MVAPRVTKIPNDTGNQVFYAAVEQSPGVLGGSPSWFRFNGQPDINTDFAILDDPDVTGTFVQDANPAKGLPVHSGTWGGVASYERLPSVYRSVLASGGSPTSGSSPAWLYQKDSAITYDDADTYRFIFGVPGDLYFGSGVRYNNFNISGSIADANPMWNFGGDLSVLNHDQLPMELITATDGDTAEVEMTGAGWDTDEFAGSYIYPNPDTNQPGARLIMGNTTDTITVSTPFAVTPVAGDKFLISGLPPAGVPTLVEEKIRFPGTKLFIDPASGTLGTTQIKHRFISFNVAWALNMDAKWFAEDVDGPSGIYGRGMLRVTTQIQLEADRPDEFRQLKALRELGVRIQQEGSELAPGTRKMARIDLPRLTWTEKTKNTRNNNRTQTLAARAWYAVPFVRTQVRNGLATLP